MCIRDRIWKPNFRSFLSSLLSAIPLALRELCYHFHAKLAGIYWLALKEPQTDLEAQFPFFPVESSQRDPTCSARALLAFPCQTCRDLLACSQRAPNGFGSPISVLSCRVFSARSHLLCASFVSISMPNLPGSIGLLSKSPKRIWKPNFRSFLSSLLSAIPLALRELCYHFHAKLAGIYWLALKEPQTDLEAQFPFFPVESSQRDPTCSARALLAFPCQTCRHLLACSQRAPNGFGSPISVLSCRVFSARSHLLCASFVSISMPNLPGSIGLLSKSPKRIWKPNFRSFLSSLLSAIPLALRELCSVSYTHLRAHETPEHLVCRLLLENK